MIFGLNGWLDSVVNTAIVMHWLWFKIRPQKHFISAILEGGVFKALLLASFIILCCVTYVVQYDIFKGKRINTAEFKKRFLFYNFSELFY